MKKHLIFAFTILLFYRPGLDAQENKTSELERRIEALENRQDDSGEGLADKLHWGAYGEVKYQDNLSNYKNDQMDVHRIVLVAEYEFNDWIDFKTEIEYEHAGFEQETIAGESVNSSEVFIEQAALNLKFNEQLQLAMGLHLLPIGIINLEHEPTTFLGVSRPRTDQNIIPSTWREIGLILHGKVAEKITYRTGVVNGPRGKKFSDTSWIRGGRTKGSKARAEDLAVFFRLDYLLLDGLTIGASYYRGDSAQGEATAVDWKTRLVDPIDAWEDKTGLKTAFLEIRDNAKTSSSNIRVHIAEGHLKLNRGPWMAKAQFAQGWMNEEDTRTANSTTGKNIGKMVEGAWGEIGFNVLSLFKTSQKLYPFIRHEYINTQKHTVERHLGGKDDIMDTICTQGLNETCKATSDLSKTNRSLGIIESKDSTKELYGVTGVADRTNDQRITTIGMAWFPDPQVVIKGEYERQDSKSNRHTDIESRNSKNNKIDRIQLAVGFIF